MAGHSKWANIKHKKSKSDAKKGKIFSRITKEIISAVKLGGADLKTNPRLRLALQKARAINMPNDNIERNIKKATDTDQANYEEMTYEIYGHGGTGLIVEIMTDNKNRVSADMRIATNKKGGSIATPGSVSFNFDRKGIIHVNKNNATEDDLFMIATEAGAEDFNTTNTIFAITTDASDLYNVKECIEKNGIQCDECAVEMIPKTFVVCDQKTYDQNMALIDWLEDLEDVDAVYHNMELDNLRK